MTSTTTPRTPERAAVALDADAEEINLMSMADRRTFLRGIRFRASQFGAAEKWANLDGVVAFFAAYRLGEPNTWISHVNAGVLEAVTGGVALALDPDADDYGNPGARAWATYLRQLDDGELASPYAHGQAWSRAKKIATDHGVAIATRHGLRPTPPETRFLRLADIYQSWMADRTALNFVLAFGGLLLPNLADIDPDKASDIFDIGNADTTRQLCEIAWTAALLDPTPDNWTKLRALLPMATHVLKTMRTGPTTTP